MNVEPAFQGTPAGFEGIEGEDSPIGQETEGEIVLLLQELNVEPAFQGMQASIEGIEGEDSPIGRETEGEVILMIVQ